VNGIDNPRTYGTPPFRVAVIHGGPGAGGEMAPVARELSARRGVLEPIQTATTLDGQVEELRALLEEHGAPPLALAGYSWGAWLALIVAARHPSLVGKLILMSSGPFEARYVAALHETRMRRLDPEERAEFCALLEALGDPAADREHPADGKHPADTEHPVDKDAALARLGALVHKSDAYDPLPDRAETVGLRGEVFAGVWAEAAEMRGSGALLALLGRLRCPVAAIHGRYDPHPAEGVRAPLAAARPDASFTLLERCGHTPWLERQARAAFYKTLERELETGWT
jgi:pimeloyl-ACP methyl ester carboxylesterase